MLRIQKKASARQLAWRGAIAVLTMCSFNAAWAQEPQPQSTYAAAVSEGSVLAERLCQSCHVIGDKPGASTTAGIPSFRGIANRPGQTAGNIRSVLLTPHQPMPDIRLSYPEIERLLAYIDSLRSADAGPPLLPRTQERVMPASPGPT